MSKNPFESALEATFHTHAIGKSRYATILEMLSGISTFIHRTRLSHEALSMTERDPSQARSEAIIQAEQLADLEQAFNALIEDLPSQALVETIALDRLAHDEPEYFNRLTARP